MTRRITTPGNTTMKNTRSTNSIKSYKMFLQYYLTEGHTQNLLVDTIKEKIYYLPKELNSVEKVVREHTDYQLTDFQKFSMETFRNQWLEFLEVELNFDYLEDVFQLAEGSLADFVLFRVSCQEDLKRIVMDIHQRRESGVFSLRQVCLVFDFDRYSFDWERLPKDPSGFVAILSADEIAQARLITLHNFKSGQQIIIQSQASNATHVEYASRSIYSLLVSSAVAV